MKDIRVCKAHIQAESFEETEDGRLIINPKGPITVWPCDGVGQGLKRKLKRGIIFYGEY